MAAQRRHDEEEFYFFLNVYEMNMQKPKKKIYTVTNRLKLMRFYGRLCKVQIAFFSLFLNEK